MSGSDVVGSIQEELLRKNLVLDTWGETITEWGTRIAQYRAYQEGDHTLVMSDKMKALLSRDDAFTDNYCELIVDYITSRIVCQGFQSDSEKADTWLEAMLALSGFNVLQGEVTEATIVDGDTFVLMEFDAYHGAVHWSHEPAWDTEQGMIPVYATTYNEIAAAVKIWLEPSGGDTVTRVNIYYPDSLARFVHTDSGLQLLEEPYAWVDKAEQPLGVPVFHFKNKSKTSRQFGRSKLKNIIPLQDALNTTFLSMVASGLLSAFQIKVAYNTDTPPYVEPGMFILVDDTQLPDGKRALIETLEVGSLREFINEISLIANEIGKISKTPLPENMGSSDASGEALKQREIGLTAEIQDFQSSNGAVYEEMAAYHARLHSVFGSVPAPVGKGEAGVHWVPTWKDPSPRNAKEVFESAVLLEPLIGIREALTLVGTVQGWDSKDIQRVLNQRMDDEADLLSQLTGLPAIR